MSSRCSRGAVAPRSSLSAELVTSAARVSSAGPKRLACSISRAIWSSGASMSPRSAAFGTLCRTIRSRKRSSRSVTKRRGSWPASMTWSMTVNSPAPSCSASASIVASSSVAVGHAELRDGLGVGDALGTRTRDHLAEHRQRVAHAAGARARDEGQRGGLGRDALLLADVGQVLLQRLGRHEAEGVVVRARADGRQDLLRLRRGEDEAHVLRRLLDELEQRVEARGRDHVGLVDDVDLVARRRRREHGPLAQVAGVLDAAVAGSVELDDVEGAGPVRREVGAALADAARIRGGALLAVQRAGEDAGRRGLAAAAGAGEQVGVVHAVVLEGPAQRAGDVVLADDVVELRRTVGAVQGHGHRCTLMRVTDGRIREAREATQAHEGTPRTPARARLSLLPSGPGEVHAMTPHEGSAQSYGVAGTRP